MKTSKREKVAIVFAVLGEEANGTPIADLADDLGVSETTVRYVRSLYNKRDELPESIPSRVNRQRHGF